MFLGSGNPNVKPMVLTHGVDILPAGRGPAATHAIHGALRIAEATARGARCSDHQVSAGERKGVGATLRHCGGVVVVTRRVVVIGGHRVVVVTRRVVVVLHCDRLSAATQAEEQHREQDSESSHRAGPEQPHGFRWVQG